LAFQDAAMTIDAGLFERQLLCAGIVSSDAQRLFKVATAVQPGGPLGKLSAQGLHFALEHAHIVAWLEIFHNHLHDQDVHVTLGSTVLSDGDEDKASMAFDSESFAQTLERTGFPQEFMPDLFNFLEKRSLRQEVKLMDLADLLVAAFGRSRGPQRARRPQTGASQKGAQVNKEIQEEGLSQTAKLRSYVMSHFADYKQAFEALKRVQRIDGIGFDDWMESVDTFGFKNDDSWALVFGHMINYAHLKWDPRFRGAERVVTLPIFATALDKAKLCQNVVCLHDRLQERFGNILKSWVHICGKDDADEVDYSQWRQHYCCSVFAKWTQRHYLQVCVHHSMFSSS